MLRVESACIQSIYVSELFTITKTWEWIFCSVEEDFIVCCVRICLVLILNCCVTDISENFAASHRIYDVEVIEFSNDVAFILILPPVEEVCLVPGQNDTMTEKKDLTLLPVQVFEMSKWIFAFWSVLFFTMKSKRGFLVGGGGYKKEIVKQLISFLHIAENFF